MLAAAAASQEGSSTFDVVTLAVRASCVSPFAIHALNEYLPVRDIHVVTSSLRDCELFQSMATNVVCHIESQFLPTVAHDSVETFLVGQFGDEISRRVAKARAGWYLQQLLKLGAAQAIPHLSDHFLLWDLDMIPLRPMTFLLPYSGSSAPNQTRIDISSKLVPEYSASYKVSA